MEPESKFTRSSEYCSTPELWSAKDGQSAEVEVAEFLFGFIRLMKPSLCLETGTWHGESAAIIAEALKKNDHGRLTTIELEEEPLRIARERLKAYKNIELIHGDALNYNVPREIDLLFVDAGDADLRLKLINHFAPRISKHGVIIMHDVSWTYHTKGRMRAFEVLGALSAVDNMYSMFEIRCPRGLMIFHKRPQLEKERWR